MRLTDVMSGADLTIYPIVALALFLLVYAGVVRRALARGRRAELDRLAMLPIDATEAGTPGSDSTTGS